MAGYGAALTAHLAAGLVGGAGAAEWTRWLAWAGAPLAGMTAVYTAYLFAQARARDLWQNPLLPPHFLVQAVLAGGAALMLFPSLGGSAALGRLVGLTAAAHLLLVLAELTLTHATAHAALAARNMVRGRYAPWFWSGILLVTLAAVLTVSPLASAWVAPLIGIAALAGLLAHEHAYVQAGQSVPLA
ncbi:MAG: hypothetical protein F4X67_06870 [Gemmatimonadales bacterium]|nr:hypothetical protein [Gemmatimonadales bacterium]